MIPNKLYIPTSTLNFNNIMSSESISPAGFYSVRGFGYRRFEKVDPNNLDNRILLYEQYPIFRISDEELENYPMIIEIDTTTIKEDSIQTSNNSVFYSEETIYFNPISTKIYFRNDSEKRSTLSKTEPSIESKMVTLYQNCLAIQSENVESFIWKKINIEDAKNSNPNNISKDKKINKLKGFLYAYILAANKSFPDQVVTLKKYAKDLRNTLSAVITSPDGQPTYRQQEQLNAIYAAINDTFYKAEGLDKKVKKIDEEFFKENKFEEFLAKFGNNWLPKPTFQLSPFSVSYTVNIDEKEKKLELYVLNLERAINRFSNPKRIQKEQLPILQHCNRIESIPEQKTTDFLSKLLNEYLEEAYTSEDFIQSRYEFAKSGGKIFKEQVKKDWDGSEYQMYINTLLKNLNEYSQFEINSTDILTLKSFAAFCQKGESDIDKLEDYLISNKIGDFRIAFALWGIVFGFANMPKTLTNDLFSSNDLDYVSEIYKYVFKQIHGFELECKLESKRERPLENQSISKRQLLILQSNENATPVHTNTSGDSEEIEFRKNLKGKKIKQEDQILEIWRTNHFLVNDKLFLDVSKIQGVGKAALEKIKTCFNFNPKQIVKQQSTTSMFSNLSSGNFLDDFEFLSNNQEFVKIVSKQKNWEKDLKWFIKEYNDPNSKYYGDKPKDNKTVIQKFIFLKKEIYKDTETLLKSLYL